MRGGSDKKIKSMWLGREILVAGLPYISYFLEVHEMPFLCLNPWRQGKDGLYTVNKFGLEFFFDNQFFENASIETEQSWKLLVLQFYFEQFQNNQHSYLQRCKLEIDEQLTKKLKIS